MKKKLMFFLILICALLTVSAVNAKDIVKNDVNSEVVQNSHGDTPQNELSTTKTVTKNSKDNSINEKPIENTNLKKTSTTKTNKTQTLKSTNSNDILSETGPEHVTDWDSFCSAIDNGKTSIIFDNDIDVSTVTSTKNIEKTYSILIDGNGRTIKNLKEDDWLDELLSIRSNVTLKNIIFKDNDISEYAGGAIITLTLNGNLSVINCTFQDNNNAIKTMSGGSLIINNSRFINNTLSCNGGVITVYSTVEIYNSEFIGNDAITNGYNGGAIFFATNSGPSSGIITNCTFNKNSAEYGGAIATSSHNVVTFTLNNCNFTENSGIYGGNSIYLDENSVLNIINTKLNNSDIYSEDGLVYPEFEVSIPDFEFGKEVTISVSAIDSFSGTVNVTINGTNYTVDLTNGRGSATVTPNLDVGGPYKASLSFEEPDYISTIVDSNEFNVEPKKLNSKIEYEILNNVTGKVAIEIKVYDEDGNEITNSTLILNGGVTGNISTNKVYKNIGLAPGEYKIAVTYNPTAGYEGSTANITLVVVQDPNITIAELQNNLTEANKEIVELKNNLADANKVIVELKDTLADANNVIKELRATIVDLQSNLTKANKQITNLKTTNAKLKNNVNKLNKTVVTLKKRVVNLSAVLKSVKNVKSFNKSKNLVLTATLNKAVKNKKVSFIFNGKIYSAKTNAKGVAKLVINKSAFKKLKVGEKVPYYVAFGEKTVKRVAVVKK